MQSNLDDAVVAFIGTETAPAEKSRVGVLFVPAATFNHNQLSNSQGLTTSWDIVRVAVDGVRM